MPRYCLWECPQHWLLVALAITVYNLLKMRKLIIRNANNLGSLETKMMKCRKSCIGCQRSISSIKKGKQFWY